jgi:hypothetical protein
MGRLLRAGDPQIWAEQALRHPDQDRAGYGFGAATPTFSQPS